MVAPEHNLLVKGLDTKHENQNLPQFVCPVPGCDKRFARKVNLQGHIRSHWSHGAFVCSWPGCEELFDWEHELKRHELLHSRPHSCGGCGKAFSMDSLNVHLASESGAGCRNIPSGSQALASSKIGDQLQSTSNVLVSSPTDLRSAAPITTSPDFLRNLVSRLTSILRDKVQYKDLLAFRGMEAQKLLDLFQWLLDIPQLDGAFKRTLIVATQRLTKTSGLYPTCYNLKDVEVDGEHPIAAGSFADIYKGRFQGKFVCMKVIRLYQTTQVDYFLKNCSKEAILWEQLSHPNLLPMYGLYRFKGQICLISPWMEQGNIILYLQANETADRVLLILDISEGLRYLHESAIVHGDLKGANILVDRHGRACIADFGLSSVSDATILAWTSHTSGASRGGSLRWQAPELFDLENDENVPNTAASDIYAWSCVCYEIFTGNIPFYHIARDASVMLQITKGARPVRPPEQANDRGLTDDIWNLMEDCWVAKPTDRPTIDVVISRLTVETRVDLRPHEEDEMPSTRFRTTMRQGDVFLWQWIEKLLDLQKEI